MPEAAPPFLVVGHVDKPHGTKGEVFVWPLTDHPGRTFAPGVVLHLADDSGDRPDPFVSPLEIETARAYRRGFLVRFRDRPDRSDAELLRSRYLLRPFDEIGPVAEGEVFYHELLGSRVETVSGEQLGAITEVYELRPADMLEVQDDSGRARLIPFTAQVVREVDVDRGRIVVDPPEGLLDL